MTIPRITLSEFAILGLIICCQVGLLALTAAFTWSIAFS